MIFGRKFPRLITLDELKVLPQLESLALVRKGNRLSVMPVSDDEWQAILSVR